MGLLDVFKRAASPLSRRARGASVSVDDDLFDDEFQRKLDYLAMVSRRVFSGAMRAERRTKKTGSGVEFADHRDYAPGDDIRYLDWAAYQRFDRLLIRLYEEEEDLAIYFILDTSASMAFGDGEKLRHGKRLCAALAYVGLANLDRITVVTATDEISGRMPSTRGKARIFRIFRFLRGAGADGATDLGEAMKTFVAQHKRRGLAVLVSDLYDPAGFERGINVLRYNKFEPFVLHVADPREARPDLRGDVRVYDCESGEEREVTVTAKVLERYGQAYEEYLEEVKRFCTARQVSYFRADVSVPFDELILRVFRRGGFLR
ncbi:DUF58 domain-containing protein [Chondromyces apiculatus]|uniref:VWFA domain-containing protein n=1 Tax=Chondromyces apiculatus DSM 436 TaxID=1192034 RepID=A0A017TI72_9BACT|nr:DUF58 domain-containing protein [Chondromyces apiculatus]EYF08978.1 Hypothetical protein CAP_0062 [Chondromyces apiculatus DSM 436]